MTRDIEYLEMAYKAAARLSTDPRTQNGAVLVTKQGVLEEANHFPFGVKETPERWVKPLKSSTVSHAETNVILLAAKLGIATDGAWLFVPWFACCECTKAIIQAGIHTVVGHDAPFHNRPDWQNNIDHADQMLTEAGVSFYRIVYKFSDLEILFDGVKVQP